MNTRELDMDINTEGLDMNVNTGDATGVKTTIRLSKEGTTIRTRNVRFLRACGKVRELTHELKHCRWDILGLVDVRWTGFVGATTDEGHKVW